MSSLTVAEMEPGFEKVQLPVWFDAGNNESAGVQFFITKAQPNAETKLHSHPGDAIRFIVSGSIFFNEVELRAGDWMFIPRGVDYSIRVGEEGSLMCYCYPCCCVPV